MSNASPLRPPAAASPVVLPASRAVLWLGRHRPARAGRLLLHRRRPGRRLGVRQRHARPRVRARRPPLPRLPLPLTRPGQLTWRSRLILRGLLAGALGGLLAFVFARIFAEPQIQARDRLRGRPRRRPGGARQGRRARRPPPRAGDLQPHGPGQRRHRRRHDRCSAPRWARCSPSATRSASGRVGNVRPAAAGAAGRRRRVPRRSTWCRSSSTRPTRRPIGHAETIRHAQRPLPADGARLGRCSWSLAVMAGPAAPGRASGPGTRPCSPGPAFIVAIGVVMALLPPLGHLAANVASTAPRHRDTAAADRRQRHIVFPGFPADVLFNSGSTRSAPS